MAQIRIHDLPAAVDISDAAMTTTFGGYTSRGLGDPVGGGPNGKDVFVIEGPIGGGSGKDENHHDIFKDSVSDWWFGQSI